MKRPPPAARAAERPFRAGIGSRHEREHDHRRGQHYTVRDQPVVEVGSSHDGEGEAEDGRRRRLPASGRSRKAGDDEARAGEREQLVAHRGQAARLVPDGRQGVADDRAEHGHRFRSRQERR